MYYQSKEEFTDLSDIEIAQFGQAPVQKDYTLLNLRFDWENFLGKPFDVSLFMDNVDQPHLQGRRRRAAAP